ncbi:pyruvate dehydrogenase protein X component, mitochondrial-like isoform X2 [Portunus trituberculatus]|uniref:pyruvate dehydrogenase protein X component, mitochondrial-like isoform X2 n=1 Tax=Portunus trituberculatus TaxID=210409 RepID=UPI001E1D1802|nr:pyruvate dehydrogenase protein X component, mitochondrial-like isoform X2 [Portunus trituberculatus]
MAGLGGLHRAASHLSRHLTRLRGVQAARHTQGHAALLHTTPALDVEGIPIKMPSLSPTMLEGTIVQWAKKEGDPIQPGDVLCDIQTDKAVVAMDIEEEGTLAKILLPDDSKDIKVGTVIALMVAEGEDWKDVEMPSTEETGSTPTSPTEETPRKAAEAEAGHGNFGPSVRLLLEQYGLREGDVPHGGPHGILVKGDVLRLIKERNLTPKAPESVPPPEAPQPAAATATAAPSQPPLPPAPSTVAGDGYTDVEVTNMRRTIAKRLTQSKSGIAHSYATMECCMDSLLELRKQYKADGVNVSVNDLIIKAVAVALTRCPEMNCVWQGDQLKTGGPVDVSIAVATPAGLITPIVRGADTRGLEDIAATVRDLATRAKANKLKLDEFQGGTFTISNLGMFGIREFSAIINPPQCGILAVGGSRLVPDESGVPVTLMASQLSYDRGAVDDLVAAEFLSVLKSILENPNSILLGSYASQPGQPHPLAALL